MRLAAIAVLLLAACAKKPPPPELDLMTLAEKTAYRESGRYDEVERLCRGLETKHPGRARCVAFGTTPAGRTMRALVASRTGVLEPVTAREKGLPVVLVQGGIHAGEIDGKEAGFQLLRDELSAPASVLDRLVVVFVPVLNVDGHELRSPHQRPNQNGPAEHGARTTAQRYNLNRQYMIADAPEAQAVLALLDEWDPLVYVDLHVTDGMRLQHEVALSVGPEEHGDPAVAAQAARLRDAVVAKLEAQRLKPLSFYPRLLDVDDPGQGFVHDVDEPRHSEAYWGLRNRVGVLVEDHSWHDFATRVRACRATVRALLEQAADQADELRRTAREADGRDLAGASVDLDFETVTDVEPKKRVEVRGYRYEVVPRVDLTGGAGLVYRAEEPETWLVPLYDDVRPVPGTRVTLPRAGWIVPPAWADVVAAKLRAHRVEFQRVSPAIRDADVEVQRVDPDAVEYDSSSHQGRLRARVPGAWARERQAIEAGSLYVPVSQPRGRVAAHLLEPQGPDSLASWGLFNTAFEVSDYMTRYRALELAQWMHDGDPRIGALFGDAFASQLAGWRAQFELRVRSDPDFGKDPAARLAYWTRKLPPDDVGLGLYPVVRVDAWPQASTRRGGEVVEQGR